jgi:hypothetical protein
LNRTTALILPAMFLVVYDCSAAKASRKVTTKSEGFFPECRGSYSRNGSRCREIATREVLPAHWLRAHSASSTKSRADGKISRVDREKYPFASPRFSATLGVRGFARVGFLECALRCETAVSLLSEMTNTLQRLSVCSGVDPRECRAIWGFRTKRDGQDSLCAPIRVAPGRGHPNLFRRRGAAPCVDSL